jgi:hypothetical protein
MPSFSCGPAGADVSACTAAPWPSPADLPTEASEYLGEVAETLTESTRQMRQFAAWGAVGGMSGHAVAQLLDMADAAADLGHRLGVLVGGLGMGTLSAAPTPPCPPTPSSAMPGSIASAP